MQAVALVKKTESSGTWKADSYAKSFDTVREAKQYLKRIALFKNRGDWSEEVWTAKQIRIILIPAYQNRKLSPRSSSYENHHDQLVLDAIGWDA